MLPLKASKPGDAWLVVLPVSVVVAWILIVSARFPTEHLKEISLAFTSLIFIVGFIVAVRYSSLSERLSDSPELRLFLTISASILAILLFANPFGMLYLVVSLISNNLSQLLFLPMILLFATSVSSIVVASWLALKAVGGAVTAKADSQTNETSHAVTGWREVLSWFLIGGLLGAGCLFVYRLSVFVAH